MKLFTGEKGYYCYVCHSGGDVVDLVRNVTGRTFHEAVAWLDSAFSLGLWVDGQTDGESLRRAQEAVQKRRQRREELRRDYDRAVEAQQAALEAEMKAEQALDTHRPRTYGEDFSDEFCDLLMQLEDMRVYRDDLAINVQIAKEAMDRDG